MATNRVFCKYQEIIDLNTVGDTITAIGIHTPTGDTPQKMFPGLFQQYRKWKYLGCSVVGANAAQLPVDVLGLGYEAGEEDSMVADPRDIMNPILFHGCHGEDLGAILNKLYSTNSIMDMSDSFNQLTEDADSDADGGRAALLEGLYYKALTDNTWKKFGIQSGFRLRKLHPLVYQMATNHYISPSVLGGELEASSGTVKVGGVIPDVDDVDGFGTGYHDTRFFTPRLTSLGWMETRLPYVDGTNLPADMTGTTYTDWQNQIKAITNYAEMPRIMMGVLLLPKSYRVKQFMRIVITHRFVFAGFRGASFADNILGAPSFFEVGGLENLNESNDDEVLGGNPNRVGA